MSDMGLSCRSSCAQWNRPADADADADADLCQMMMMMMMTAMMIFSVSRQSLSVRSLINGSMDPTIMSRGQAPLTNSDDLATKPI